jgi:hypothetical protein
MGSPRTCGCRGGVIVPLRPDVKVEADPPRVDPVDRAVEATQELRDVPEQLSLFGESPEP